VLIGVTGAVVFLVMFFAALGGHVSLPRSFATAHLRASRGNGYEPKYTHANGEQLVMVYVGSARCVWANDPQLPKLVEQAKLALETQAARRGWSFEAIGIAVDWIPEEGLDHLRRLGRFDEVSAGYGWANLAAAEFFNDRVPEPAATPEVLVLRRSLTMPNSLDGPSGYVLANQQVVARKSGLVELRRWVQDGALVPALPAEP
jgi:hypothetical protein